MIKGNLALREMTGLDKQSATQATTPTGFLLDVRVLSVGLGELEIDMALGVRGKLCFHPMSTGASCIAYVTIPWYG